MFVLISLLAALASPGFLRVRRGGRAGKGARHRTPGLARMSPAPRSGRHLLIRPSVELHPDEAAW